MSEVIEIANIDKHFAKFIIRLEGIDNEKIFHAALLLSASTREGHTCLDLSWWASRKILFEDGSDCVLPKLEEWLACLSTSNVAGSGQVAKPLVLEGSRLYLQRYWEYENEVGTFIKKRSEEVDADIDLQLFENGIKRLLPGESIWPKLAALSLILRPLVVIAGGPGTGKTTTVARVMALLLEQRQSVGKVRIALAAPTGKAVMRLQAAIIGIKDELECGDSIRDKIPVTATTIHRLLGPRKDSSFFYHDKFNPLPHDLVIIDEASMVDLPMMAKLMQAMNEKSKLVLLGDRNQLASVEPGAVLGDICRPKMINAFSGGFIEKAQRVIGGKLPKEASLTKKRLGDSMIELRVSHRFDEKSGIGRLSRSVREGRGDEALDILADKAFPDVSWLDISSTIDLRLGIEKRVVSKLARFHGRAGEENLLESSGRFQVMCAVRNGSFGVLGINSIIGGLLAVRGLVNPAERFYAGRPVMIIRNDYGLDLYNGDTGTIIRDPGYPGGVVAAFPGMSGGIRKISPYMLPEHETVYAMTIHKSQGSEFDEVVLVLPDKMSPVLSRELIYTAITRTRNRLEVWGRREIFLGAVKFLSHRDSGLQRKLSDL